MTPPSPRPSTASHSAPHARPPRAVPDLDLSRSVRQTVMAAFVLIAAIAVAAVVPLPATVTATTSGRLDAEPVAVRPGEGGVIAKLHAREGAEVTHGTPIATLDTRLIDSQIAGLKRQIEGTRLHISGLKEEASGLASTDLTSPQRQRLASLEAQIATSEQEALGLEVRLAMASQERERVDIRAPISGRILKLAVAEGSSFAPGAAIAIIQPAADRLILEATFVLDRSIRLDVGAPVDIRESDAARFAPMLPGRVDQILADDAHGVRVRIAADRPSATASLPDTRERRFTVYLVTGHHTLFQRFADALAVPAAAAAPPPPRKVVP